MRFCWSTLILLILTKKSQIMTRFAMTMRYRSLSLKINQKHNSQPKYKFSLWLTNISTYSNGRIQLYFSMKLYSYIHFMAKLSWVYVENQERLLTLMKIYINGCVRKNHFLIMRYTSALWNNLNSIEGDLPMRLFRRKS